jgi:hypothetical protein
MRVKDNARYLARCVMPRWCGLSTRRPMRVKDNARYLAPRRVGDYRAPARRGDIGHPRYRTQMDADWASLSPDDHSAASASSCKIVRITAYCAAMMVV